MNYGYIRVSTDKQTVENQRFEIGRFAPGKRSPSMAGSKKTISGTKSYNKRELGKTVKKSGPASDHLRGVVPFRPQPIHDHGNTESVHE